MIEVEQKVDNIILEYPVRILREGDAYIARKGCEFFMDEHNIQWVKFVPSNGYRAGHEHIVRTDRVVIVREETPPGTVRKGDPIGATIGEPRPA